MGSNRFIEFISNYHEGKGRHAGKLYQILGYVFCFTSISLLRGSLREREKKKNLQITHPECSLLLPKFRMKKKTACKEKYNGISEDKWGP